jgi:sterol desaturase/sphingolipid hydroxylase (fatty acid hydroxylase superfamily)
MTSLWTSLVAGVSSFGVLAFVFVPLERAFPARSRQPIRRPALLVDACFFFGQYVVWNAVSFAVLGSGEALLHARVASGLGVRAFVAAQPVWAQAIAAVIVGDLCVYWFHRACHAWEPLWRFHAVHHTAEHLDWLAAHREHPVDGICTAFAANLPAFAMGFRVDTVAAIVAFRGVWAIFVHSNVRLPLGPLRVLLGAPELHHWHHAKVPTTAHNFANLAPWLDVLFGTYHRPDPDEEEAFELGVTEPMPRSYLGQLAHPFVAIASKAFAAITSRGSRSSPASSETLPASRMLP